MSRSSVDPFTRIRQLEAQICCLKKEGLTTFYSNDISAINYANPVTATITTSSGVEVGPGVTGTYADAAALIAALVAAGYDAGFGTFTEDGDRIKLVTVDSFEVLTIDITN